MPRVTRKMWFNNRVIGFYWREKRWNRCERLLMGEHVTENAYKQLASLCWNVHLNERFIAQWISCNLLQEWRMLVTACLENTTWMERKVVSRFHLITLIQLFNYPLLSLYQIRYKVSRKWLKRSLKGLLAFYKKSHSRWLNESVKQYLYGFIKKLTSVRSRDTWQVASGK